MSAPHISIVHSGELDTAPFEELRVLLRCEGLDVQLQSAPKAGPFASLEWLIPTAVVLYIAKAYFEAFLAEAGKDHYEILKRGAKSLARSFTGEQAPTAKFVASKGKVQSSAPKYSLVYSVMAELEGSVSVKLLLQTDFAPERTSQALDCFFEFLRTFHSGELDPSNVLGLAGARPVGNILLLAYDPESHLLKVIDPVPKDVRDKQSPA